MICKPLFHPQIHIHGASAAVADSFEKRSIIHGQCGDARLRHPQSGSVVSGECEKLGSVVHGGKNAGNFPRSQASFPAFLPAFTQTENAGNIPRMANSFFDRIEMRLAATQQTEEAASKRAGRNRGYIRDLKRKSSIPNAKNIADLAMALECTAEYLLGFKEDTPTSKTKDSHASKNANDIDKKFEEIKSRLTDEQKIALAELLERMFPLQP
jgi:transcriptional regulator with XRE-family HTH domain